MTIKQCSELYSETIENNELIFLHKQRMNDVIDFYILMLLYELQHFQGYTPMSILNDLHLIKIANILLIPMLYNITIHEINLIARKIYSIQ